MCCFITRSAVSNSRQLACSRTPRHAGRCSEPKAARGLTFVLVAAALLVSTANAAVVTYSYNTTGNAAWTFTAPVIPPPMAGDVGQNASYYGIVNGTRHGSSGQPSALISGSGGTMGSHPTIDTATTFFFANDSTPTRLLMSWNWAQPIQEVRTYSWHEFDGSRRAQNYTLYGSNVAVDPNNWTFDLADWTPLATVNSGSYSTHPNQTAVRVQGDGGAALGNYQHLLWDIGYSGGTQHTFFREFDVISGPSAITITPAPGHAIMWDGVSGPATAAGAVPNNLALQPGVTAFGSGAYPAPAHSIAHINDGSYGNSKSWLAAPGDNPAYIGLDLGGLKMIDGLAWGRDNTTGGLSDRWVGTYTLQYTRVASPGTATTETGNASTGWANIGTVTYSSTPQDGFVGQLRKEFDLGFVAATGVRMKVSDPGIAIDEMELYFNSPVVHLRADQAVVDGSGNVMQWTDQSGNSLHATPPGTAPTLLPDAIGDLPLVHFGGGDRRLDLPNMGPAEDYEVFIVARSNAPGVGFLASSASYGHYEAHLNGSAGARFIPDGAGGPYADLGTPGQFADGQLHTFNFRVDGDVGYIGVDGFQGSTVASARSAQNALLSLGIRAGDGTYPFIGDMGEVLIFDRALTAAERSQVNAYLAGTWGTPYGILMSPAAGHSITWNGVSGPQTAAGAVPDNLALRSEVTAFGSSEHPAAAHAIAHINDGMYGNDNSWLANLDVDNNPYIGVDLGGRKMIDSIAWGRSNTLSHVDRWAGTYTLQYTQVTSQDMNTLVETGDPQTGWANMGDVTLGEHLGATNGPLRHQFDLSTLVATGVRIKPSSNELAIDELELYGAASYPEAVLHHQARGYWKLDDPSTGTAAVNSGLAGNSLNAGFFSNRTSPMAVNKVDATGLVYGATGPAGAAYFNGTAADAETRWAQGSGINTASSTGGNVFANEWTIETWFERDAITSGAGIFSQHTESGETSWHAPILTFDTGNRLGIMDAGQSWTGVFLDLGPDHLNKEVYAVMTKTGANTINLYAKIEGEDTWRTTSGTIGWTLNTSLDKFLIGHHYLAGGGHAFSGTIDDLAIYDFAMTFDVIQAHYAMGIPEPSALLLLAMAVVGLAAVRGRRK